MGKSRHVKSSIDVQSVLTQGTAAFWKPEVKFAARSRATAGKFLLQGMRGYAQRFPVPTKLWAQQKLRHSFSKVQEMPPGPFSSRTRAQWELQAPAAFRHEEDTEM